MSCSPEFPQDTVFNPLRKKHVCPQDDGNNDESIVPNMDYHSDSQPTPPKVTHPPEINKALLGADDKQTGSTSLIGGAQPLPIP